MEYLRTDVPFVGVLLLLLDERNRPIHIYDTIRTPYRINLDLYHTQIGEGDLTRWCEKCLPWIGEIQVADNPGRCEPGTGEINYPLIAQALEKLGYAGPVGLESWARNDAETALESFRQAFTLKR